RGTAHSADRRRISAGRRGAGARRHREPRHHRQAAARPVSVGAVSARRGRVARMTPDSPALRIGSVSVDCPDPGALADFYAELFGMTRIVESPDGRVVAISDGTHTLAMMTV